jgi:tetratricopeptide (TPR) repeat protein
MGTDGLASRPVPLTSRSKPKEDRDMDDVLRATNQETVDRARRFMGFGDAHFAKRKYADAYQRYRKAVEVAPGLTEAYFRQGFALVATGRYELANKMMRRGLAMDPGWPQSGFRLAELYGPNDQDKAAHLDAMAEAAGKDPNNVELLFLIGVCLHFDGKRERAAPFFERAAELSVAPDYLKGFLVTDKQ